MLALGKHLWLGSLNLQANLPVVLLDMHVRDASESESRNAAQAHMLCMQGPDGCASIQAPRGVLPHEATCIVV